MDLSRAAAGLLLVVAVLAGCGDDDDSAEADRSGTTEDTTTTSAPASTSAPATTDAQAAADADVRALAIWPRSSSTVTFATPEDVARSFALYYAQFADPVVGAYRAGDARSGEVPVQPFPDASETTVLVRQINDGTWYVVGSTTEDIAVSQPAAGASLQCPQPVAGTALAFEGQVEVRVDAFQPDGARVELGRGYVTGSGAPPAGPFSADISCRFPTEEVEDIAVLAFWTVDMAGDEGNTLQFVSMPLTLPG